MTSKPIIRPYRRKHFYKVTWTRSDKLLSETPWLKPAEHEFCMLGYRQPTPAEAEKFIGNIMYDRLFDQVTSVQEISKEEALRDFRMDNWRSQKVFGKEPAPERKSTLDDRIRDAAARSSKTNSLSLGEFHIPSMLQVLANNAWTGKGPTEARILAGDNVIELSGYVYEPYYEQFSTTGSISLNGRLLYGLDSRTVEGYRHEVYQKGICETLEDAIAVTKEATRGLRFTLESGPQKQAPTVER